MIVLLSRIFNRAESGTLEMRYEVELPDDVSDTFGYDEEQSFVEFEDTAFDIGGDDTITIVDSTQASLAAPAV